MCCLVYNVRNFHSSMAIIDILFQLFISFRVDPCNIMANHVSLVVALLFIVTFALAQITNDGRKTFKKKLPVRLGSDGRPLLFAPKIEMCQTRKKIKDKLFYDNSLKLSVLGVFES